MPREPHKPKVAFSVTNCICYDQRVLKMAGTVSRLTCDITIIGRSTGDCCNSLSVPFRTKRFSMIFRRGFLFYGFYNIRLFIFLLFHKYDLLVSNDLDSLLPNFLISKLKRLLLVYDSHEYFTGLPEIQNRPFVKWVWKTIEKLILPRLSYTITVSEPIASLYENMYRVGPIVIRNLSKNSDLITPFTRSEIGMCIEKDTNLNYRYSLPNKLFDYIAAGIPVIASDPPETGKIIKENNCGMVIKRVTPHDLSNAFSELKNNPDFISELRRNSVLTSEKLNWDNESEKVKEFYDKVLFCRHHD